MIISGSSEPMISITCLCVKVPLIQMSAFEFWRNTCYINVKSFCGRSLDNARLHSAQFTTAFLYIQRVCMLDLGLIAFQMCQPLDMCGPSIRAKSDNMISRLLSGYKLFYSASTVLSSMLKFKICLYCYNRWSEKRLKMISFLVPVKWHK